MNCLAALQVEIRHSSTYSSLFGVMFILDTSAPHNLKPVQKFGAKNVKSGLVKVIFAKSLFKFTEKCNLSVSN